MKINESNLKFKSLDYSNKPKKIIYHHAEAKKCTIFDVHSWHLGNGWSGIGYHYFVGKDGSVWTGRPENALGAHTLGHNDSAIGICAEGAYMTEIMPQAQKQALIELGIYLKNKYKITEIYGHKDLNSTDCPGKNYPLEEIKNAINKPINNSINKLYKVQVGAYKERANAENMLKQLENKGFKGYIKEE